MGSGPNEYWYATTTSDDTYTIAVGRPSVATYVAEGIVEFPVALHRKDLPKEDGRAWRGALTFSGIGTPHFHGEKGVRTAPRPSPETLAVLQAEVDRIRERYGARAAEIGDIVGLDGF